MTTEKTNQDGGISKMASAGVVAQRVQIRNIYLSELVCRCGVITTGDDVQINASVQAATTTTYETDQEELRVTARCSVVGRTGDATDAVRIDATFCLVYDLPPSEDLAQEDFDAFGEINGLFNLWPFWRELAQNMTVRMGLPPLILPVKRGVMLPRKSTKPCKAELSQPQK